MRKLWLALAVSLAVVGGVILVGRSPIDPVAWTPPVKPELHGALAPNLALRQAERLAEGQVDGPEDVDLDNDGTIYCGVADGRILQFAPGDEPGTFADTGGRPLGLDFDAAGVLWVADSELGLLSIGADGTVTVRSTEVDGTPIGFADDVDVAPDGKVYLSDASTRFGPDELLLDALEARPHGRLLEHDPVTDRTRVVLRDLYFANGVAVAPDGSFVLVAETFRYRVRRLWLTGPEAGQSEIFVDNLPGFPDGISGDGQGTYWLALYGPRSGFLDRVAHPRPWLKRLIARLPRGLQGGSAYGLVVALDADGRYLRSLHDPAGDRFAFVTSVEPRDGAIYLGSIEGETVGRLSLEPAHSGRVLSSALE